MKKYMVMSAAVCVALAFTSCKSSESAYRQAYNKAKAAEEQQAAVVPQQEVNVVTPLEQKPATETRVLDNADNVQVRQESVSLISGTGLKAYSVVVGSFLSKANAEGLQQTLKAAGYDAQVVKSDTPQAVNGVSSYFYRVISTTFDNKADAAASRNEFLGKYPGSWLLYNTK